MLPNLIACNSVNFTHIALFGQLYHCSFVFITMDYGIVLDKDNIIKSPNIM